VAAFQHGIVTSAALVPVGRAVADARDRIGDAPGMGLGIHLCLDEEAPASPPKAITSLIGSDGRFLPRERLLIRLLANRVDREEVRGEFRRQVEVFLDLGLFPDHITTHGHIHTFPRIAEIIADIAEEYRLPRRIRALRPLRTGFYSPKRAILVQILACGWRICRRRIFKDWLYPQAIAGLPRGGRMVEADLMSCIARMSRAGLYELVLHPGEGDETTAACYRRWGYRWEDEFKAACSSRVLAQVESKGVELVSYDALT
jgi:predicted glycoside hydrolase/deacetylase ChbG (UPF0249 family)